MSTRPATPAGGRPLPVLWRLVGLLGLRPWRVALSVGLGALAVVAGSVLGGLASSRLDNALVRGQQLAVSVSANVEQHEQLSVITVSMDVKPGSRRSCR